MAFVTSTTIEIVGDANISKELLRQCSSDETDRVIRLEKVTAYVNAESPWSAEFGIRQVGTPETDAVVWFDMTVFELEHVASVLRAYQAAAREENSHAGETGGSANVDVLGKPILECDFSGRVRNLLHRLGINNLGELASRTEAELMSFNNVGPTMLREVRGKLSQHGLTLRDRWQGCCDLDRLKTSSAGETGGGL